jgi:hypothetical protein
MYFKMKKLLSYWRFFPFVAFLVYSCTQKKDEVVTAEPNIDYVQVEKMLTQGFAEVDVYKASNPYDFKKIGEVLNAYSIKETGRVAFDADELQATLQKYEKYNDPNNPSLQPVINALMNDKVLSGVQGALLSELDAQMVKTEDLTVAIRLLDDFEYKIIQNTQLNGMEKTFLRLFKSGVKTGFQYTQSTELARSPCSDCLVAKKWKIFGFSGLVALGGILVCIALTGGFGGLGCVLGIAAGWVGVAKGVCPMCFRF